LSLHSASHVQGRAAPHTVVSRDNASLNSTCLSVQVDILS
jgi:hypothetical protein